MIFVILSAHHIQILSADCLVQEAVKAFHDSEETEIITEEKETRKENQVSCVQKYSYTFQTDMIFPFAL